LKTIEKIVDRHIRNAALRSQPLYRNQHAYQIGESTETALHNMVARVESAIEHKDIALGAFLDLEGTFDRTSFDKIKQAVGKHGMEPAICRWISAMLESRTITATLSGETLSVQRLSAGGCALGLCCGVWSWTIFYGNSMIKGIIQ
jgi:hypothetical protein